MLLLSPEIRAIIWRFTLDAACLSLRSRWRRRDLYLPRVCRQINIESKPFMKAYNTLYFERPGHLYSSSGFLHSLHRYVSTISEEIWGAFIAIFDRRKSAGKLQPNIDSNARTQKNGKTTAMQC
jgi:hypothetical protein